MKLKLSSRLFPLAASLLVLLSAACPLRAASDVTLSLEMSEDGVNWTATTPGLKSVTVTEVWFRATLQSGAAPVSAGNPVSVTLPSGGGVVEVVLNSSPDLQAWAPVAPGVIAVTDKEFYRVDAQASSLALIPAGSFTMGDSLDGLSDAPPHTVNLSAYYIMRTEVTKAEWDDVTSWAQANGYDLTPAMGTGKAGNHPVSGLDWYQCVKFANARSEREGLTPVYTVAGVPLRSGTGTPPDINYAANGYRLPTEAEWEKAARGGLSGKRFPWGDIITHGDANYYSTASFAWDTSLTRGFHPDWDNAPFPYTSPVASFAPNGYGLYDVTGNVHEWCNDLYDPNYYNVSPLNDPIGPLPPATVTRVIRGGSYGSSGDNSSFCRVAFRRSDTASLPDNPIRLGFRLVRRAAE